MLSPATNIIAHPANVVPLNSLPPAQYDARNVTGLRYIEIGQQYSGFALDSNQPANRVVVSLADIDSEFAYDPSYTFRVVTIGLDSYSIRHKLATTADPDGFSEDIREPIAVSIPQIQADTGARYTAFLPNDFNVGIASTTSVSLVNKLPPSLTFVLGLVNPVPTDGTVYNFNAPRPPTGPTAVVAPNWASQYIRSITIRFYVKVSYETNAIPYMTAPRGVGAPGLDPSGGRSSITDTTRGGGGSGASNQVNGGEATAALQFESALTGAIGGFASAIGADAMEVQQEAGGIPLPPSPTATEATQVREHQVLPEVEPPARKASQKGKAPEKPSGKRRGRPKGSTAAEMQRRREEEEEQRTRRQFGI